MFLKNSYINYDEDDKGNKKIKKSILIALAIIVSIIIISLALTDIGLFPGNILNRFAVSSFIDENYNDADPKIISYCGYNKEDEQYEYKCEINGNECVIGARNFSVTYDGYYEYFGRNVFFEGLVRDYMNSYLENRWVELYPDYDSKWNSLIDIPIEDTNFPCEDNGEVISNDMILKACKLYGESFEFTVEIYGDYLEMEEYKFVAYMPVKLLQGELDNRPSKMQILYYRNNNDKDVLQYESLVETYQFDYNEAGIAQSSNMHKYVEVPEDIQRNYHIYYMVKDIFIIILTITVIGLSVLWCVRRYKKYKKDKAPLPKDNDDNN